jgi:hypothetical protein
MTAIEAIIYCLGYHDTTPEDGEIKSQVVYDRNGEQHWIAWMHWKDGIPRFCSEYDRPFSREFEPYEPARPDPSR